MIRVVIIDDEIASCENLTMYLNELFSDVEIIGEAHDMDSGLELIRISKPDLIFLDIDLGGNTGFELIEKLPNKNVNIIFVTGSDQHAISAFRYSAIDYLLKPIDPQLLVDAFNKFRKNEGFSTLQQRLLSLLENKNAPQKLALPTSKGYKFILTDTLLRCESDGSYTYFFLNNGEKILVCRPIKEYDQLLSDNHFFRIHQSHLINLKYVKEYSRGDGGSVMLEDGTEVLVARRRKDEFLDAMLNFNHH